MNSYDAITVGVSGKLALCSHSEKGNIILDVQGGQAPYTFLWNNKTTTKDRDNLYAGSYTVEITDANGKVHTEHIVIQPPYPLILNPIETKSASCGSGADGYAKIGVKVGRGEPYQITWSHGLMDTWEAEDLKPGTYSVTVADKYNCDVTVSFEIKAEAEGIEVTESIKDLSCSGQKDGAIQLSVSGGSAPYTYKWSNGATTKDLTNISAGVYQLQVFDDKGCSFQAYYEVENAVSMELDYKVTEASCQGNGDGQITLEAKGGNAPYTYTWSTGETGANASNLNAGTYTAKVTDASGCFVEQIIEVGTASNLEVELKSSQDIGCNGAKDGAISLGVKGAFGNISVKWNDGTEGLLERSGLEAGTYEVSISDESGCSVSKVIEVSEPEELSARIESSLDVDCAKGSVTGVAWVSVKGGKEPYTITWNTGSENAREINFYKSSILKVNITDASGCTTETEAKVDFPNQDTQGGRIDLNYRKLEINSDPEVQVDEEIIFESTISEEFIAWEWSFGDGLSSTDKDPIHVFNKPGTFEVKLTGYDIFGCSSVESNTVQVNSPTDLVVIPNAFTPNGDGLNDTFIPKIRAVSYFNMDIFNTWGERIYNTSEVESSGWDGTYSGQALPAGNYLYKITFGSRDGEAFERTGGVTLIR